MNIHVVALLKGYVLHPKTCRTFHKKNYVNLVADNPRLIATIQANILRYGYMFDKEVIDELSFAPFDYLFELNESIVNHIKSVIGDDRNYQPIYKNFPREVMEMSDCEFFINAILHYMTNGDFVPESVEQLRPYKLEKGAKYTILKLARAKEFNNIFTTLCGINTSLTPQDKSIVEWFINSGIELKLPNEIPFKETLCMLVASGVKGVNIKSVTDILRVAVYMSGGDVSLPAVPKEQKKRGEYKYANISHTGMTSWFQTSAQPTRDAFKFKNFTRAERRTLLEMFENNNLDISDMATHRERWLRLGEKIHPGEFAKRYPKAFDAFNKLRNGKIETWNAKLEKARKESLVKQISILRQKPGEFARKLDSLVRKNINKYKYILGEFQSVADKISNKVLFELANHFEKRSDKSANRSVMIKGKRSRKTLPTLNPLPIFVVEDLTLLIYDVLYNKFKKEDGLGKCWIDPELKKIPLPSNMRDMSASTRPMVRGTRFPFGNKDTKVIRAYVHWFDERGNIDIDLSATFVGDDKRANISYHNKQVGRYSVHSGDVRHRRGACAEYIDIDIADVVSMGYKYCLVDVRNYNGGSLKSMKPSFGFMEREFPEANPIWVPETISSAYVLTSEKSNTYVCVLDLETREYIVLDVDSDGATWASGDSRNIMDAITQFITPPKFSLYDLLRLHVSARGIQVVNKEDAEKIFEFNDFLESYEKTAQYMGIK